jgi:uncharacterized phage-like protein YoqJ
MKCRVLRWAAHVARRNIRKIYSGLLGKYEENRQRWNPNNRLKYIDLLKTARYNDMEWIHLAQESAECRK